MDYMVTSCQAVFFFFSWAYAYLLPQWNYIYDFLKIAFRYRATLYGGLYSHYLAFYLLYYYVPFLYSHGREWRSDEMFMELFKLLRGKRSDQSLTLWSSLL